MQSVWKYTLEAKESQKVEMPLGAKILSAEEQNDQIVIYAIVDPDEETYETFVVVVVGTGHETHFALHDMNFLNTVKMENGKLMFHVFYRR